MDHSVGGNRALRGTWKPSEYLARTEELANRIRKQLRSSVNACGVKGNPASKDDAEKLAELVEELSQFGQRQSAAVAVEVAERVELLLPLLISEIDRIGSPEGSM